MRMEKKFKFNIVDILVVAVLIVGILFVGSRLLGGTAEPETAGETYRVTFFAECVPEAVADHLIVGSTAENNDSSVPLGTLISVTTGESVVYVPLEDGTIVASSRPGYISCTLVCELTGVDTGVGLKSGSFKLNVGHDMVVRSGNAEVKCYVQDIVPVEAE